MSIIKEYMALSYDEVTPNRLTQLIHDWRISARHCWQGYEFGRPTETTPQDELELFARLCAEKGVQFFKPTKGYKRKVEMNNWSYEKWQEARREYAN